MNACLLFKCRHPLTHIQEMQMPNLYCGAWADWSARGVAACALRVLLQAVLSQAEAAAAHLRNCSLQVRYVGLIGFAADC